MPPFFCLKARVSAWKARHGTIVIGGLDMVGDTSGAVVPGRCWRQLASLLDSPASPELSVLHLSLSILWESGFLVVS